MHAAGRREPAGHPCPIDWKVPGAGRRALATCLPDAFGQTIGHGLGVFAVDASAEFTGDHLFAVIVTSLDAIKDFLVIHHIRLGENDRAVIDAVGQQIPRPKVGVAIHLPGTLA